MKYPIGRPPKNLYHVGDLDPSKHQAGGYEGSGLSVSTHPEAWKQISRGTGGDTWQLSRPSARFLDYHRLTDKHWNEIVEWAVAQGYAKRKTVYRVSYYDDELEDKMSFDFPTREAAEEEAEEIEDATITELHGEPVGTAKLKRREGADHPELLAVVYAEDVLKTDGVWWSDRLDVLGLSAPRGVIFNRSLPKWKRTRVAEAATRDILATLIKAGRRDLAVAFIKSR